MSKGEEWNPFEGLPEEVSDRPSTAWLSRLNDLLSLVDSRGANVAEGKGNKTRLHLAVASVALVRSVLLGLKGVDAEMEALQELVVALSNEAWLDQNWSGSATHPAPADKLPAERYSRRLHFNRFIQRHDHLYSRA